MTERKREKRTRRSKWKVRFFIVELILIGALVWLLLDMLNKKNQFPEGTIINSLDCSKLTIDDASQLLKVKQNEKFYIMFKNYDIVELQAYDFGYCLKNIEPELKEIKDRAWNDTEQKKNYQVVYSYDEAMLEKQIDSLEQMSQEYMKNNSKFSCSYSQEDKKFVASNQDSYYLDKKDVMDAIKNAIVSGKDTATIGEELYKVENNPKDYSEMNNKISTYVEYQLPSGEKYKLDADILHSWLPLNDEGEPYFDEDVWEQNLEDFVSNELKSVVETTGKFREFKPTSKDENVTVNPGNYGYKLDAKAEILQLTQDLSSDKNVTRKPVYEREEVSSENDGIGNSYVEIDLTRQHVWVYIDGEMKIETDCVTGCVSKDYDTPTGVYYLEYKRKGKMLIGKKDKNGKPEYETWVDYWMPFNGNIGLHDATWRKDFGGDIFLKDGSHGCVNLPPEKAKEIFTTIEKGIPVIVYESKEHLFDAP